jgi:AcrR family transcriptional regulator
MVLKALPAQSASRADQIIEATRKLFIQYGYRRTAMDDIAQEGGMAKATLYAHFDSKDDVFAVMVQRCRTQVEQRCKGAEALPSAVSVRLAALLYAYFGTGLEWFGHDSGHLKELRAVVSERVADWGPSLDAAFHTRLKRFLEAAAAAGELDLAQVPISSSRLAQTILHAASGAKKAGPEPKAFRIQLQDIALIACAAARPRPRGAAPESP